MKTIWLSKLQRKLLTTAPALQLMDGFSLHTYADRLPYPRLINFLYHLSKWITAEQLDILLAALTLLLAVLTFLLAWRVAHPPNQKGSDTPVPQPIHKNVSEFVRGVRVPGRCFSGRKGGN
jgi:hypothetical protein